MVSKSIRKTPTKSINRPRHHHRRKKSPIKAASAAVLATINNSIFLCQRRLAKFFSKLAKITSSTPTKHGFQLLKKLHEQDYREDSSFYWDPEPGGDAKSRSLLLQTLPSSVNPNMTTVFLDLDETLVHSTPDPAPERFDFVVKPVIDGRILNFYVLVRPGLEEFLEAIGTNFEVVVFTAGLREYASLVLDRIDVKGLISHRLYRDSCKEIDGKFVKDLSEMGRDLKRAVIVDDNPNAFIFQPENAIPMKPFVDDLEDGELKKLGEFFRACDGVEDIRDAVKRFVGDLPKSES